MLDQRSRRQIPEDLGARRDTLRVKSATWNPFVHCCPSSCAPIIKMRRRPVRVLPPHTYASRAIGTKKLRGQNGRAVQSAVLTRGSANNVPPLHKCARMFTNVRSDASESDISD